MLRPDRTQLPAFAGNADNEVVAQDPFDEEALKQRFEQISVAYDDGRIPQADGDQDEALFRDFDADAAAPVVAEGAAPAGQIGYDGPEHKRIPLTPQGRDAVAQLGTRRQNEVVAQEEGGELAMVEPRWYSLSELPGYMGGGRRPGGRDNLGEGIRMIGRTIFRAIPCYARMEQICRNDRRDPLGEVRVLANIAGRGPTPEPELRAMVEWVHANGSVVNNSTINFDNLMPGYRPRVILAVGKEDSYLLVQDSRANGAPVEGTYIYTWRGGHAFYQGRELSAQAQERPAIAGPAARDLAVTDNQVAEMGQIARAVAAQPEPAANARPRTRRGRKPAVSVFVSEDAIEEIVLNSEADKAEKKQKAERSVPPLKLLRESGYNVVPSDSGPELRKVLANGTVVVVTPDDGKSLSLSRSFECRILDGDMVIADTVALNAGDVEDWVQSETSPGMKP
ncbi:hypothetical protein ACFOY8_13675 [Thalassospira xianhensis]|uniref:Uncharacterized protein n=1 Tax=Thalassospira xianhensis MCCC 1A02616 TaxID=1177929 RepID=A0A367UHT1_9PROT|nr:hypothetical protein [Thalassospira xianhensis]RCK07768.1 hypothetical protein TH5_01605 [Thalassospira xianhensis MCCC 1A02616]